MRNKIPVLRMQDSTVLQEKVKESLSSVLPVTGVVFLLCFTLTPVPNGHLMGFVLGAAMLILGMGLFTLGTDLSMTPIGSHVGGAVTRSRKIWLIALVSMLVGTFVTVSEPDLQVLAEQVPGVPNLTLIIAVAVGVGTFLVVAMLRMIFCIRLSYLLIGLYALAFVLAAFVPKEFLSVAFDAGGVTTGPMTVPFIMALGLGVSAVRSDSDAENDSFGLVALCSVGPILAVLVLGIVFGSDSATYVAPRFAEAADSRALCSGLLSGLPVYARDVAYALLPILLFFLLFQVVCLRLKWKELIRIGMGLVYTFFGLVLFLTGANYGFLPVGNTIGVTIGSSDFAWLIVPIGMLIGFFLVEAEPAVHVLNRQVMTITAGAIPERALSLSLSIGVACSVGLSMVRILTDLPILWLLIPGYAIAAVLTFFCPPLFTAIAFDSGGVASGPMTASFLLPLAIGVCDGHGGDVIQSAFGVVAMVAMTPLIAIQILGVVYQYRSRRSETPAPDEQDPDIDIISFD